MKIARFVALFAIAVAALPLGAAFAQYPPVVGVCTVVPDSGSIQPNSVASFTVTARTANGDPAPNVAGTVSIASGSGTVLTPTFVTGPDGTAKISVQTGANPGDLSLAVNCGAIGTSVVVRVSTPAALPKPPDTGAGVVEGDSTSFGWLLVGMALVGAAGAAGAVTVTARRK